MALIDVNYGEINFRWNGKKVTFNVCKSMKQPKYFQVISMIDVINDKVANTMKVDCISEPLVGVLINYKRGDIEEYDEVVASKNPCKLDFDWKN